MPAGKPASDPLTNPTGIATTARVAGQVADLIGRSLTHASTVETHSAAKLDELAPRPTPDR